MAHTLLIVDDERDLVETCVRLLARRGYGCLAAHTGREGIALIDRERPSVVLTDLYLPDVDGLSVLRHASEQVPPIPGILMTAADTSTDAIKRAQDAGALLCLPKPFSHARLLEARDRALKQPGVDAAGLSEAV
jgi:DNA-binding NtrC family response regulator